MSWILASRAVIHLLLYRGPRTGGTWALLQTNVVIQRCGPPWSPSRKTSWARCPRRTVDCREETRRPSQMSGWAPVSRCGQAASQHPRLSPALGLEFPVDEVPRPHTTVFTVHLDEAAALDERCDGFPKRLVVTQLLPVELEVDDVARLLVDLGRPTPRVEHALDGLRHLEVFHVDPRVVPRRLAARVAVAAHLRRLFEQGACGFPRSMLVRGLHVELRVALVHAVAHQDTLSST